MDFLKNTFSSYICQATKIKYASIPNGLMEIPGPLKLGLGSVFQKNDVIENLVEERCRIDGHGLAL